MPVNCIRWSFQSRWAILGVLTAERAAEEQAEAGFNRGGRFLGVLTLNGRVP